MSRNPFRRRSRDSEYTSEDVREQEYWLSYSDLMAGLLMVFVLLLVAANFRYTSAAEYLKVIADRVTDAVTTMAVRDRIIDELQEEQEQSPAVVRVDSVTGAITLSDGVLFEEGSSVLQPRGERILGSFIRSYLPVVMDDPEYRDHLREIAVEGHTNDNGTYLYNVRLSQARAYAVMDFFIQSAADRPSQEFLMRYLTAKGRSYSRVVCGGEIVSYWDCPPGQVDKAASRRIEIHFRLDDEEVVRRVKTLLDDPEVVRALQLHAEGAS